MKDRTFSILLVEDDHDFGNVLKQFLELNGFEVILARNGNTGLSLFKQHNVDICVLDVMLPEMDGFTLAGEIKRISDNMPFLFLTARIQKTDRIKGLKLGADDYICKPFDADELVLRIENILRRMGKISHFGQEILDIASYKLDNGNLLLSRGKTRWNLTKKEAGLLKLLAQNPNRLLKRSDILLKVWGEDDYFLGRSMDVFVSRLRKYLSQDKRISIENIRGIGLKLNLPKT
jgi:DNA-binding response OmpR family regulator